MGDVLPAIGGSSRRAGTGAAIGAGAGLLASSAVGASNSQAAAARLYSLVETSKANGVEPHAYLTNLFTGLPAASTVEQFKALLPWNVKNSIR